VQRAVARDAGIVDEHVDRPEHGFDLDAVVNAGFVVADIPAVGGNARALGEVPGLLQVAGIVGDHRVTLFSKGKTNRLTDASRTTRYNRHTRHRPPLFTSRFPDIPKMPLSCRQGNRIAGLCGVAAADRPALKKSASEAELGAEVDGLAVLLAVR
jgi:hypothetical protein